MQSQLSSTFTSFPYIMSLNASLQCLVKVDLKVFASTSACFLRPQVPAAMAKVLTTACLSLMVQLV